jgi:signal transduction histidine kinase/ligand-binding sensor domain-containing protein
MPSLQFQNVPRYWPMLLILGFGLAWPGLVRAERLPVKVYTTADGLSNDLVLRIKRDSHGFLWFCTGDGLSKFDGYQFTSYGRDAGLPHPRVNDLIESRDGTYWVATNGGGVCRFSPAQRAPSDSAPRFTIYSLGDNLASNRVNRLCEDREGRVWAGTDRGLFYFDPAPDRFIAAAADALEVYSLRVDRQGLLWAGVGNQLWRRSPDGRLARYSFQAARDLGRIFSLLEDDKGRLWVGSWYAGLFELDPQRLPRGDGTLEAGKSEGLLNHYTSGGGAAIDAVTNLHQSRDGHLWIATPPNTVAPGAGGLLEFDGQRFRRYGKAQGLRSDYLECLAEDRDGNLWLGSVDGSMKIARNGFTTFDENDGPIHGPGAILESKSGELCVITEAGMAVNRFADGRFIPTRFNLSKALQYGKRWGSYQISFQDRGGDWWVPTSKGLMRFPKVARLEQLARARPKAHYLISSDRNWVDVYRMFEDTHGDIWVALASREKNALVKWERATETFHTYAEADGVPPFNPPTAFCEDAHGNLWIGLYDGGLLRYRAGRFTVLRPEEGLPSGLISALYLDQQRRLWIASSSDGVGRMDDPGAERPAFVNYTTAEGLSSNVISSITEDRWGRIYLGMPRGVDRLDPVNGNITRYSTADGLPKGDVYLGYRDASGALWFGGSYGVARLVPTPDEPPSLPPVLITGLRVAGVVQPLADLGEVAPGDLELGSSQNHIEIDFVGLSFGTGEMLQYQYQLEGADRDWRPLTTQRSVNFANLAAGAYRFVVRAVSADGVVSEPSASFAFTILPPVWQRWWFVGLAAGLSGLLVYSMFRYHLARLLELERVRTRIAADLHDDIGAGLSRVAILSEVVKQQVGGKAGLAAAPLLTEIADSARGLLAATREIVWAIDPQRAGLDNLAAQIRQFASDLLEAQAIRWEFRVPEEMDRVKLDPEQRRQLLLIFKEALHNIERHSGCTTASLSIALTHGRLAAEIRDDGRGFVVPAGQSPPFNGRGNGLANMRRRAEQLGGHLDIRSTPGRGTRLDLTIPLKRR